MLGDPEDPTAFKLSLQSMQRIQQLIEAQRNFLRYYEVRERMEERRRTELRTHRSSHFEAQAFTERTVNRDQVSSREPVKTSEAGGSISSDSSDKENSHKSAQYKKQRKVAKLNSLENSSLKRKSIEEGPEVPEKVSRVDKVVGTEPEIRRDEETQTEHGANVKLVVSSRKRIVARLESEKRTASGEKVDPQNPATEPRTEAAKSDTVVNKPWRTNMKPKTAKPITEEAKPPEPKQLEKPWRVNMKPTSTNIEASVQVLPKTEKTEPARPWRINMKPQSEEKIVPDQQPKRRHYDRETVRRFMLEKKKKQREERERVEKENLLRQELIKQRLEELEKLQKQIAETDFSEEKKILTPEDRETAVKSQELLREKLLELTIQMKKKWRIKQTDNRNISLTIHFHYSFLLIYRNNN